MAKGILRLFKRRSSNQSADGETSNFTQRWAWNLGWVVFRGSPANRGVLSQPYLEGIVVSIFHHVSYVCFSKTFYQVKYLKQLISICLGKAYNNSSKVLSRQPTVLLWSEIVLGLTKKFVNVQDTNVGKNKLEQIIILIRQSAMVGP